MNAWLVLNLYSHNAKVDPLEEPRRRVQSPSAYTVAMDEFKNGGFHYYYSDNESVEV